MRESRMSWWKSVITNEERKQSSQRLRNVKAMEYWAVAEHIKPLQVSFHTHSAVLFTGIIKHGFVPVDLRKATTVPILKDQNGN